MRRAIISAILLCQTAIPFGQQCVISAKKENMVYIGIPNPIDVAVEGRLCKDFSVGTNNGVLEKGETACSYLLSTTTAGTAEVSVKEKKSGKIVGKAVFRVKELPAPTVKLAGKSGGEISRSVLRVQIALSAMLEGFDFDAKFVITRYRVSIFRGDKMVFTGIYHDLRFPPTVTEGFQLAQADDTLVFSDMVYEKFNNKSGILQPIEFKITE